MKNFDKDRTKTPTLVRFRFKPLAQFFDRSRKEFVFFRDGCPTWIAARAFWSANLTVSAGNSLGPKKVGQKLVRMVFPRDRVQGLRLAPFAPQLPTPYPPVALSSVATSSASKARTMTRGIIAGGRSMHAAAGTDRLTRQPAGIVGREKDRDHGDVPGLASAAERGPGAKVLLEIGADEARGA
jgi:hypothetical protein